VGARVNGAGRGAPLPWLVLLLAQPGRGGRWLGCHAGVPRCCSAQEAGRAQAGSVWPPGPDVDDGYRPGGCCVARTRQRRGLRTHEEGGLVRTVIAASAAEVGAVWEDVGLTAEKGVGPASWAFRLEPLPGVGHRGTRQRIFLFF
jgi:hypothetical protein